MNPAERYRKSQLELEKILDSRLARKASFQNSKLEDSLIPEPDPKQVIAPKKKYKKIIVVEGMSEEEADRITLEESSVENVKLEIPSTYEQQFNDCRQSLNIVIEQIKKLCDNYIGQFQSGSAGWRRAVQKCRAEFGNVDAIQEYLDTFKSKPIRKSEIAKWVQQINQECGGKLDKMLAILNYMLLNPVKRSDGQRLCKGRKVTIAGRKKDYVVFYKEKKKMLEELQNSGIKIKSRQLDKYIRFFAREGIIERIGKSDSRGAAIYGTGYWNDFKDKNGTNQQNPIALYRVTALRDHYDEAFRNFSTYNRNVGVTK